MRTDPSAPVLLMPVRTQPKTKRFCRSAYVSQAWSEYLPTGNNGIISEPGEPRHGRMDTGVPTSAIWNSSSISLL